MAQLIHTSPPRPAPAWLDLPLGDSAEQRRGIKRYFLRAQTYAFAHSLHGVSVWLGLCPASQLWPLLLYSLVGQGAIYALLRTGATKRMSDPELTLHQVLFGISALGLAYVLSPMTRNADLLILFLLFVFDLQKLESRQINLVASGALVMLAAMLAGTWWHSGGEADMRNDVLNMGLSAVLLPILAFVGKNVRLRRKHYVNQKAELAATLERLRHLSARDGLTGLFNRRKAIALMDEEIKRYQRTNRAFAVAILDIDLFKRINDSFGHAVGDDVLRDFARLMQQTLDGTDSSARWGGEEFLVLFPEAPADAATAALERLRDAIKHHDWAAHASGLQVSFSAGVASYLSGEPIDRTLERADQALYHAKAAGRDCILPG